jgi:hypothetical protein
MMGECTPAVAFSFRGANPSHLVQFQLYISTVCDASSSNRRMHVRVNDQHLVVVVSKRGRRTLASLFRRRIPRGGGIDTVRR